MTASGADTPPHGRRGARLRDAILARYGTEEHFITTVNRLVDHDPERTITSDLMYSLTHDPDRWPNLLRLETLAAAAGWTMEQLVAELGTGEGRERQTDFADLPRLRRLLRANLTRIEPGPLPAVAAEIRVPLTLTALAEPWVTSALQALVVRGPLQPLRGVARASPNGRLSARVGDLENAAYPKIPPRALLRVDRGDTDLGRERYSLIEHPNGLSCCCAEAQGGKVILLPEPGSGYPRLEFSRHEVTVHGHIVAMAGQVGRRSPPMVWTPDAAQMNRQPDPNGRYGTVPHPAKTMVRAAWRRRGRSYGEHDRGARRRQRLLGKNGKQPRSTLRPYVEDSDKPPPRPDFETLFGLSAAFDLDYQQLLQAFGLSPGVFEPRVPDAAETPSPAIAQLRGHAFGAYLEELGWDLPWLCALSALADKSRVYHLGQLHPGWSPLLKRGCFVVVNHKRQTVPRLSRHAGETARRDWERPMFLLETPSRPHLLCGYCEQEGDVLHVLPHPDETTQAARQFQLDVDVEVIGQVTHVATLLP
jgi:hypothetical protein